MATFSGNLVGSVGSDSTVATGVAANYLKASASTNFGTRQLSVVKIVGTSVDFITGASLSNSLYSQAVRALQQTAEVYTVFAPVNSGSNDYFCAIIAFDTQWDGQVSQDSYLTDGSFDKLEAAISKGVTGTPTFTVTLATIS